MHIADEYLLNVHNGRLITSHLIRKNKIVKNLFFFPTKRYFQLLHIIITNCISRKEIEFCLHHCYCYYFGYSQNYHSNLSVILFKYIL